MARLREDRSWLKNFVEETLRFETPVLGLARKTTRDVEVHGTPIPEGSMVVLTYAAANRDEDKFDDGVFCISSRLFLFFNIYFKELFF